MRAFVLVALAGCATPTHLTRSEHIGGAITAGVVGFGTGQAIQGRWTKVGWIITAGELVAMTGLAWGGSRIASQCPGGNVSGCDDPSTTVTITSALVFAAFRLWGTIDAAVVP